jgi:hypothetical protein
LIQLDLHLVMLAGVPLPITNFIRIDWPEVLTGLLTGLLTSVIWFLVGALIRVLEKDRSKFHGRWETIIKWHPDWARQLMGSVSEQPHSEGKMSLSYGAGEKKNQYYGLSFWTLKDGTDPKSQVCAEVKHIHIRAGWFCSLSPYLRSHRLVEASLYSVFRSPIAPFHYRSHVANYDLFFTTSTPDKLVADVKLQHDSTDHGAVVGQFTATRLF